jgi:hypothetical protein
VALRPEDLAAVGTVPEVVFSEACYGAAIAGRAVDSALCLKFLESGTRIMIGSTCVAYRG